MNGQEVVVKVQRPGLKDLFDIDLKNLRVSVKVKNFLHSAPAIIFCYEVALCPSKVEK